MRHGNEIETNIGAMHYSLLHCKIIGVLDIVSLLVTERSTVRTQNLGKNQKMQEEEGSTFVQEPQEEVLVVSNSTSNDFTLIPIQNSDTSTNGSTIRFVVLSDTHNCQDKYNYWYDEVGGRRDSLPNDSSDDLIKLPRGDYLIHAGDFTNYCLPSR